MPQRLRMILPLLIALLGLTGCDEEKKAEEPAQQETQAATGQPTQAELAEKLQQADPKMLAELARLQARKAPSAPVAGGIQWEVGGPFMAKPPANAMRAADYQIMGEAGPANMAVFYFGPNAGAVDANVQRWVGQFTKPDGTPIGDAYKTSTKTVGNMTVTVVDVEGNFGGGMMPGAQSATGQRMLAAIVQGPQGPVFFKMTGPKATVDGAQEAFDKMLTTFKPAPAGAPTGVPTGGLGGTQMPAGHGQPAQMPAGHPPAGQAPAGH